MKNQPEEQPIKSEISIPSWHTNKVNLSKTNWQKLALAVVTAVVILIGGVYVANQTSIPTPLPSPSEVSTKEGQPTKTPDEAVYTEATRSANWKTYINNELLYKFKYPPNHIEPSRVQGDTTFVIGYLLKASKGPRDPEGTYWITLGYISQAQLNVSGITYCGAYPNDSPRCESITIGGVSSTIDWGMSVEYTKINKQGNEEKATQSKGSVWIPHPKSGIVTIELQPVVPESKDVLYQILSTFRFLDTETSDGQMSVDEKKRIDSWVTKNNLNEYGDSKDRMYVGGTPLFNEATGETIDRYDYILKNHPDRPWDK